MKQHDFRVGDRVELHPATDLWMQGARFGNVVALTSRGVRVQLDKLRRPVTFPNDLLTSPCPMSKSWSGPWLRD